MSAAGVRIGVVQHSADCGPLLMGAWLRAAGADLDVRLVFEGERLPEDFAALLVLGGPMGARDDDHPWLAATRGLIARTVHAGVPFLGVCLGHQLAAVALGGEVERNPRGPQVGVLPVGWRGLDDRLFGALRPERGIHFNDDVVSRVPAGATVLASAPGGEPQVVRYAERAWGLQLHPEVDLPTVRRWAADDAVRHAAAGIDQGAVLRDVDAALPDLVAAWAPVASAFVELAS